MAARTTPMPRGARTAGVANDCAATDRRTSSATTMPMVWGVLRRCRPPQPTPPTVGGAARCRVARARHTRRACGRHDLSAATRRSGSAVSCTRCCHTCAGTGQVAPPAIQLHARGHAVGAAHTESAACLARRRAVRPARAHAGGPTWCAPPAHAADHAWHTTRGECLQAVRGAANPHIDLLVARPMRHDGRLAGTCAWPQPPPPVDVLGRRADGFALVATSMPP